MMQIEIHGNLPTASEHKGVEIDMVSVGSLLASKSPASYAPFLLRSRRFTASLSTVIYDSHR